MRWSASDAESGLRNCLVEVVNGGASTPVSTTCSGHVNLPVAQNGGHLLRLTAWDNVANRAVQEQVVALSSVI
jgi:hypothetical protein